MIYNLKEYFSYTVKDKNLLVYSNITFQDNDSVLRIPDEQLSFRTNQYVIPSDKAFKWLLWKLERHYSDQLLRKNVLNI